MTKFGKYYKCWPSHAYVCVVKTCGPSSFPFVCLHSNVFSFYIQTQQTTGCCHTTMSKKNRNTSYVSVFTFLPNLLERIENKIFQLLPIILV